MVSHSTIHQMADHDYTHIFIFQDLFQLTDLKLWAEMSASSLCEKNFL